MVEYTFKVVLCTPAGKLGFKHCANLLAKFILCGKFEYFLPTSTGCNRDSQLPISAHYLFL